MTTLSGDGLTLVRRMKLIALLLLFLAAALYCLATALAASHPAWGYAAAFAEAAMVGAIADWFAVTALFRHPLGLPIPHTAIIPRNKAGVGRKLSDFICLHFLATPQVLAKLEELDAAGRLAGWLRQPDNAAAVASQATGVARYSLEALREVRVQAFIRRVAVERLQRLDVAALSGELLDMLTADGRHQAVLDEVLQEIDRLLQDEDTQALIARTIGGELRTLKYLGLDERVGRWSAIKVVQAVSRLIGEISHDREHELRRHFDGYLVGFIERLKEDPAFRLRGEQLRDRLLEHPALAGYLQELWDQLVNWLQADLSAPDSRIRRRLGRLLAELGDTLSRDEAMRRWINEQLMAVAPPFIDRNRQRIGDYIAARVAAWDTDELVQQLEQSVGKDLQFIRINGTLVGGLVGLVLHALTVWLGPG